MMTKDMTEVWSKDFVPEGNRASNVDRFTGFEDTYDQHRPEAPQEVVALLTGYLERKPSLVVDLGCGTGLSSFAWKDARTRSSALSRMTICGARRSPNCSRAGRG